MSRRGAERNDEKVKEVKTRYQRELEQLKAELKSLKAVRKEHAKAMKKNVSINFVYTINLIFNLHMCVLHVCVAIDCYIHVFNLVLKLLYVGLCYQGEIITPSNHCNYKGIEHLSID